MQVFESACLRQRKIENYSYPISIPKAKIHKQRNSSGLFISVENENNNDNIKTNLVLNFSGTTGLSRPLSGKTLLGRSSLSKASGAKSASKMTGEEESLERCVQSIVENCVRGIYGCALHVQCTNE